MFFGSWEGIGRILLVGSLAYIGLVLLLRISGKRTLSKLNAFDLVVTVALGSTLATILLSRDVPLLEGLTALGLLIGAQMVITAISVRFPPVRRWVTSEPRLLAYRGRLLRDAMHDERLTEDEIHAAIRGKGLARLEQVGAVVLESDASLHVVPLDSMASGAPLLRDVDGYDEAEHPRPR